MVIRLDFRNRGGWLMMELAIAMAILLIAIIPLGYSFTQEQKLARALYYRSVAMEIVDGEAEFIRATNGKGYKAEQDLHIQSDARKNLPRGKFLLLREATKITIEWRPIGKMHGGPVRREIPLR